MNALTQVFMFILMLSIASAKQAPNLVRKEAVLIDGSASVVQHIQSRVSKHQHSGHSALIGKIEQGGKCLAAKRHADADGIHELEMVDCTASDDAEEWEADSVGTPGQIKLADGHDVDLCLEADHGYDDVELVRCSADSSSSAHQRQLFNYSNHTNNISIEQPMETGDKLFCVTVHDHDSDGVFDKLKLEDCTHPVESKQEFVFEQSHHSLPASSQSGTAHYGKIEHPHTTPSKCVSAHETSTDDEDLEVVDCAGDADDDNVWEADEVIESGHASHAPQQIKLRDDPTLCLTADSALEEVELRKCHTHSHHHRQMWVYDATDEEFKMEDPATATVKCMASEPEAADPLKEPEDNLILESCTDAADQQWEWVHLG